VIDSRGDTISSRDNVHDARLDAEAKQRSSCSAGGRNGCDPETVIAKAELQPVLDQRAKDLAQTRTKQNKPIIVIEPTVPETIYVILNQ
jgi:hypothetical protein